MAQMSRYCKAYLADELRQFPEWSEQAPPLVVQPEGGDEAACFFLHDDFVVTAGAQRDENVVFDRVTDAWKAFCRGQLDFAPLDAGDGASV